MFSEISNNKYEIAGSGTYGIVVTPALPNKNNIGKNIKYPKNVTKIYKNKKAYKNAISTTKNIQSKIPDLHINVFPYKRRYTVKNLPKSIKRTVNRYLNTGTKYNSNSNENTQSDSLYMLRTPNLGISVFTIETNPFYYRKVRALPYKDICLQMYKCMNIVKAINDAGYIHGDIRETNVLLNLDTATMTIIDFDWLKTFDNFFVEYPTFYYSHPPECLFIWGRYVPFKEYNFLDLIKNNTFKNKEEIKQIYDIVNTHLDYYFSSVAAEGMVEFIKYIEKKGVTPINLRLWSPSMERVLFNTTKDFIDSYGLAYTFYKLLYRAWYINTYIHNQTASLNIIERGFNIGGFDVTNDAEYNKFSKIRKFIFLELIPKMVHSNYTKRWNITTALTTFKYKLLEIGIEVPEDNNSMIIDELRRMELLAMNYSHMNNDGAPIPEEIPSEKELKNTFNNIIKNEMNGGRRKTRKNRNRN
jgi:hypothetical protein